MNIKKSILLVLVTVLFTGCGTVKRGTVPWEEKPRENPPAISVSELPSEKEVEVNNSASKQIKERQEFLKLAYNDWKGIPYVWGGSGYNGIDCSAFMQVVFEDYFFVKIPRTTQEQLTHGRTVRKSNLETGDLVFFKTGRRTYHVGVMVNRDEFLHASTSEGVKISTLDHPFWEETFLVARRVM
ncbi:MAG TPA: NlpC/P60 family protein [Gracilimonas sp.]|uniref:NlpC/P60 family protein n=1 Tax=Gracilimonas sp. TaxID=1974203 RepID=UPI002DB5509B|nr:NlpC/P60 family protein [Gracilimonas sp.]